MKHIFYAAFAALSLFTFSSCHKDHHDNHDNHDDHTHTGTAGALEFEMEHIYGPSAFQVNTAYVDANGDTVVFSSGNYYISHIRLIKTDGSYCESALTHEINLAIPGSAMFDIADIPYGDYTGVQFALGTDASAVFGSVSGSVANAAFDYEAYNANGPAFTSIFDFGSVLTIAPNAAPVLHMSLNMESLFANGINPVTYNTIAAGTTESESFLSNMLGAVTFEHLHQ